MLPAMVDQAHDANDSREAVTFQRALELDATTARRLDEAYARLDRHDDKIDALRNRTRSRAASCVRFSEQLGECQEHHRECEKRLDECEKDRREIKTTMSGLQSQVSEIKSQVLPGNQ
jgi:chromosome segregation ATPase